MVYKIINSGCENVSSAYIKSNDSKLYLSYLIFFIQYEFSKKYSDYGLVPRQMANILTSIYRYEACNADKSAKELDIFDIWEENAMAAYVIDSFKCFYKDGLETMFDVCASEIDD